MIKKVTLKDVSQRLNISQNTVSMALRDRPGIKKETKEKVFAVAREMGYLTKKRNRQETKNICILATPDNLSDNYFYMKMQYAIETRAMAHGYSLLLYNTSNINTDKKELLNLFKKNHIKGVIILGDLDIAITSNILDCRVPIITSGFYYYNNYTDCVIEENAAGIFKATEHLIENGYIDIGFIGNPKNGIGYLERYMGFAGALEIFGLRSNPEWIITGFTSENEFEYEYMAEKLNGLKHFPQAFICASDLVAMILVKALHSIGKSVPGDVGIVGFDNSEMAKMCIPALTTIDVNIEGQADTIIRKLLNKINGDDSPPERVVIPTCLVPGASLKYNNSKD
jgi:LacI family transcriptional regulator